MNFARRSGRGLKASSQKSVAFQIISNGSRLVGRDLRAWHRLWTDYGALGNNPLPLRPFFPKLTQYPPLPIPLGWMAIAFCCEALPDMGLCAGSRHPFRIAASYNLFEDSPSHAPPVLS